MEASPSSYPRLPGVEVDSMIAQCAESKVWTCRYGDKDAVLKHRFPKAYRHATLDLKLRTQRTQREGKALVRAKKFNVVTPTVYHIDKPNCTIVMERIKGKAVRDVINELASKIPHEILRTRANDVFLKTIKAEEAEDSNEEAAAAVASPNSAAIASPSSHHNPFNISVAAQNIQSAAHIVAASGLSLSPAETAVAVANLEALESLGRIMLTKMGAIIGCLHNGDIIHGDLTTANFLTAPAAAASNIAESNNNNSFNYNSHPSSPNSNSTEGSEGSRLLAAATGLELVVIDFGLVRESSNPEERAVDLYVLQRAITSAHPYLTLVLETILLGYNMTVEPAKGKATMDKLVVVRARGRKRSMIG